jgi:hypothetical protein
MLVSIKMYVSLFLKYIFILLYTLHKIKLAETYIILYYVIIYTYIDKRNNVEI